MKRFFDQAACGGWVVVWLLGGSVVVAAEQDRWVDEGLGTAAVRPLQGGGSAHGFLGVMAREVAPELSVHLGMARGFGLVVEEVVPDSPAFGAGLEVHDVLVEFNDQRLVNMAQLQALTRSLRPGTEVRLRVIQRGEAKGVAVRLAGRPDAEMAPTNLPRHGGRGDGNRRGWGEWWRRMEEPMRKWGERRGVCRREAKERHQEEKPPEKVEGEAKRAEAEPGSGGGPLVKEETVAASAARVIRRDESGEYVLSAKGGKRVFAAKPKSGEGGEWPVDSEAEIDKVPEGVRGKLKELLEVELEAAGGVGRGQ